MKFRIFSDSAERTDRLNREVQSFIDEGKAAGLKVVDKTVHVLSPSIESTLKPNVVITVWMEKPSLLSQLNAASKLADPSPVKEKRTIVPVLASADSYKLPG